VGYHAALDTPQVDVLSSKLDVVSAEMRGFAYEGAAMALAILDALTPWPTRRLRDFLDGPGVDHIYMAYVGAGWALARLRRPVKRLPSGWDPILGWLAMDGYGFHEGYFHWPEVVERQRIPSSLSGYARNVFLQGLGRSLWFVFGADVERIERAIGKFPSAFVGDLWSGVGLACAYAGGIDDDGLAALVRAVGDQGPSLAQGAAFAAKARDRAGNPAQHTERACRVICGVTAQVAVRLTDIAFEDLPVTGPEPAYEIWRRRLRTLVAEERVI